MNNLILNAIEEVKSFIAIDQNSEDAFEFCDSICVKYGLGLYRIYDASVLLNRLESERPVPMNNSRYKGEGGSNFINDLVVFAVEQGIDFSKIN